MTSSDHSNLRPVFIRGKALDCVLGNRLEAIIDAVTAHTVRTTAIAFTLTDPDERRPYYLMPHTDVNATDRAAERYYQPLYDTVEQAIADAGLTPADMADMGVFLGSTSMDIPIYEALYAQGNGDSGDCFTQTNSGFGSIAGRVAEHFKIGGPCFTFTTACTSSANGLLHAAALIGQGDLPRALVIGYDRFNKLGFYGFESLKLLSSSIYRPFDKARDGIIMGEAAGAAILDHTTLKQDDFRILGGANACDTYNVALHNTDGGVVAAVMTSALQEAGVQAADITAVKAHATGSYHNDLTEACAIRSAFNCRPVPVTGLKPYLGHTVGASGVVELVLFSEALRRGLLPATPGFQTPDEELGLTPLTEHTRVGPGVYLLNYFGFGGNCTTLVVSNRRW